MDPIRAYVNLCHRLIGGLVKEAWLLDLKKPFESAGTSLVFKEYLSTLIMTTIIMGVLGGVLSPLSDLLARFIIGGLVAVLTFLMFYLYPVERADSRRKKLNAELPLALSYMASVMGSGAPPLIAFKMVSEFKEYEELSKEMKMVYKRATVGGKSLPMALEEVARITPSKQMQGILRSLKTEIISGGNITRFFEQKAADRRDHNVRLQKEYQQTSDTLSTIYLVVALVIPLMFITMIGILNFISSSSVNQIISMPLSGNITFDLLSIGVFVGVPFINIVFIVIVKTTQPEGM